MARWCVCILIWCKVWVLMGDEEKQCEACYLPFIWFASIILWQSFSLQVIICHHFHDILSFMVYVAVSILPCAGTLRLFLLLHVDGLLGSNGCLIKEWPTVQTCLNFPSSTYLNAIIELNIPLFALHLNSPSVNQSSTAYSNLIRSWRRESSCLLQVHVHFKGNCCLDWSLCHLLWIYGS